MHPPTHSVTLTLRYIYEGEMPRSMVAMSNDSRKNVMEMSIETVTTAVVHKAAANPRTNKGADRDQP